MGAQLPLVEETKHYKIYVISITLTIVLTLSVLFLGIAIKTRQLIAEDNLIQARALMDSVVMTREWNDHYGGVYVEKKKGMQSSPYLQNPDIHTIDGKVFTKKNHAVMTREISEHARENGLFTFHITSLTPLN